MDDLVNEFLIESQESLDRLDDDLLALEDDPANTERIASVFRSIHTIKGTCGFLGFGKLEKLTHVGENLLALLRDGELVMDNEIASALLELVDAVRIALAAIEDTGAEAEDEHGGLVEILTALQQAGRGTAPAEKPKAKPRKKAKAKTKAKPAAQEPAAEEEVAPTADVEPAKAKARSKATPKPPQAAPPKRADSTIRIPVELLDQLMNLVGELVLTRNQIVQLAHGIDQTSMTNASQQLSMITSELQERVMKTRMQPIGNVWNKFPRVVRDLAVACGKSVKIEMEGQETELDKTILEAIKDPLTHLVRNSVDHGIEDPEERAVAGKPQEGTLTLRAFHEGGQVNIEIVDDGKGLDSARIKAKAVEKGLITPDEAQRMPDDQAANLIFQPGFSTAAQVTNVSGRGVGMDVVRTNIERIGGSVDVQSAVGVGTTIRVKIPLTLAIIPVLIVTSRGDRYAIPQVNLIELVRLEGAEQEALEQVHGVPVHRLRGHLLPLIRLRDALGHPRREEPASSVNIVVLRADGHTFGLVVDEVNDTEEIVVKPLSGQFKGMAEFAGATIMGDGTVSLILDVLGIAQEAGLLATKSMLSEVEDLHPDVNHGDDDADSFLLLDVGEERRLALPLSKVSRLEEFEPAQVEPCGARMVAQYRGGIMPLIDLCQRFGAASPRGEGTIDVVVHSYHGQPVGLVVESIVDIVHAPLVLDEKLHRDAILGTAVLEARVTEVLDVDALMETCGIEFDLPLEAA